MRGSAAYKSYTFNCCWLLVDFPGVGSRALEESREINHRNNEVTLQRKHYTAVLSPAAHVQHASHTSSNIQTLQEATRSRVCHRELRTQL